MANRLLAAAGVLLFTGLHAVGQEAISAAAPAIRFSVVSIKEDRSDNQKMSYSMPRDGDSISYTNYPLFNVIIYSNDFHRSDLVFGLPEWTKNTRYDIVAKVASDDLATYRTLSAKQRLTMFQQVLADRFQLQFHRETRELPALEMTIAKGGAKLRDPNPSAPLDLAKKYGQSILRVAPGHIEAEGTTMADLATFLSAINQDRQVVDETGLTGKYDFSIQYSEEIGFGPLQPESETPTADANSPSLPTALREQLGLQLKSGKAPLNCFVVDHIERPTPD